MDSSNKITAIYVRVAAQDNVEIEHQKESLCKFAVDNGYANIKVYCENGVSGATLDRPEWNNLRSEILDGKIGRVIVRDVSRLARNAIYLNEIAELFSENGVDFISVNDGIKFSAGDDNLRILAELLQIA